MVNQDRDRRLMFYFKPVVNLKRLGMLKFILQWLEFTNDFVRPLLGKPIRIIYNQEQLYLKQGPSYGHLLRGVQALHFRKHYFDLWVGGVGLDMYQQL